MGCCLEDTLRMIPFMNEKDRQYDKDTIKEKDISYKNKVDKNRVD